MPRRTRNTRPKVRRQWTRNPATQIQPNRRQYDRKRAHRGHGDEPDMLDMPIDDWDEESPPASHGRILGIDFGERRVGLAISDPAGRIAQGLDTLETENLTETLDAIEELAGNYGLRLIVVGLPVNMDGAEGEMAKRVREFARKIEDRTACDVTTWDERLTSAAAERTLAEMGRTVKGRKAEIDRISATIILQGYLDSIR